MSDPSPSDLVSDALDPVLVAAGFLAGQAGQAPDGSGQVIFCIAHGELCRRHPRLPQANPAKPEGPDGPDGPAGRCDDLVVDLLADGTIARVDLEGLSLAETLRHVGLHADAEVVAAAALGWPVAVGLAVVEPALARLFGADGRALGLRPMGL